MFRTAANKGKHAFNRLFDALFGYDFFISYTWRDANQLGRTYALDLKNRLTELGYTCFLDSTDYAKGDDWKTAGQLALRRTRKLILVATPAVFDSEPVLREIRLFRDSGREIIPIDIRGTLAGDRREHALTRLIPSERLYISQLKPNDGGGPSDTVIDELRHTFKLTRQRVLRRRVVTGTMHVLLVLLAFAGLQWWQAVNNAQRAERNFQRAQSELLRANVNLARAHEQMAVGILKEEHAERDTREYQRALLHTLQAQRQAVGGRAVLRPQTWEMFGNEQLYKAFAQRWVGPATGPKHEFSSIALSPNGKLLATVSGESVFLWDTATGRQRAELRSGALVKAIAFTPDGSLLAYSREDKAVHLWDGDVWKLTATLQDQGTSFYGAVAFSPDGTLIAENCGHEELCVMDTVRGEVRATLKGHQGPIRSVAFSPDSSLLASAANDLTVRLWDASSGRSRSILGVQSTSPIESKFVLNSAQEGNINSVAFSPNGSLVACASDDHAVHLWDTTSADNEVKVLRGHLKAVKAVTFSPDGSRLASGSDDGSIRLWGKSAATLRDFQDSFSQDRITAIEFSSDSALLASLSDDGAVRLWDAANSDPITVLKGHTGWVSSVAFSPDGATIASASGSPPGETDNTVRLWDTVSGQQRVVLRGHQGEIGLVAFSPIGGVVASASKDRTIRLWDATNGKPIATLEGHEGSINAIAFSPDGALLASASGIFAEREGSVRLWDTASGELSATLPGNEGEIMSVAFSPDGSLLAIAPSDATVRLWDIARNELRSTLKDDRGSVASVAFSPDGSLLASNPGGFTIRLWNVATGEQRATLQVDDYGMDSIAFSPDGSLLAAASTLSVFVRKSIDAGSSAMNVSQKYMVYLWDVASGELRATLRGHEDMVNGVAFSPDGSQLASASGQPIAEWDNSVRLWDPRPIYLLNNGNAPSARAAVLSEALQRLWGLRMDGQDLVDDGWPRDPPENGYPIAQRFSLGDEYGPHYADRTFTMRPLLDPPRPDEDKLDQVLRWVDELCGRDEETWDCVPPSTDSP